MIRIEPGPAGTALTKNKNIKLHKF
jgi:hypothetical protein